MPTRKTSPIHNDVPENTTFLLPGQPSGEANTTGTLISKIDEVAINAKTANWKAIVMFLILQSTNKRIYTIWSLYQSKNCKNASWKDFTRNPSFILSNLLLFFATLFRQGFFYFDNFTKGYGGSRIYLYIQIDRPYL